MMTEHTRPTLTSPHMPIVLAVGCAPALLARVETAARGFSSILGCDLASAHQFTADLRPCVLVVTASLFDLGGAGRTIDRVARADCSVLITGDRSPALDNVARALHDRSMRCDSPFVAVDCALIPAQRLEEEIFGRAGHLGETRLGAVGAAE